MMTLVFAVAVFLSGLVLGVWLTSMARTWTIGRLLTQKDREIQELRTELRSHRCDPP